MKLLFTTEKVHPRDRLAFWREEASRIFVAHEFSTSVGRNFRGEIAVADLGDIGVARMSGDPCTVARTPRCLASATDDDFILCRQSAGSMRVHQDGRDVSTGPGDVFVLDPRRPFTLSVLQAADGVFFKIPRAELEARLGDSATWTAKLLAAASTSSLASEFLFKIAECADAIDAAAGRKIVQQALDLVAIGYAPTLPRAVALSSARATTLLRIKSIIEGRLHDPTLRPADAAHQAGISVRYANALLAVEGTSLERYIIARRLERCRQALESTSNLPRTIGDIAYSFGFADLSHFTRRFREQFGCSPREVRPRPYAG